MEDNITAKRDELLLKGLKFEINGEEEKAIKQYQLAAELGSIEAKFSIAWIYLRKLLVQKSDTILATKSYEHFCSLYANAPIKSIDGLFLLWLNTRNSPLDTQILQFIADKADNGDAYAQKRLQQIKEILK